MFDDLINDNGKLLSAEAIVDLEDYEKDPKCIKCGSYDYKEDGGVFLNSKLFRFGVTCKKCQYIWHVFINENIQISKIEGQGYDNSTP